MVLCLRKTVEKMKKTLFAITTLLVVSLTPTICSSQEFGTFKRIESFMSMKPNELEKELINDGYVYVSEDQLKSMTLKNFKKKNDDNYVVNYGFNGTEVVSFQWNDKTDKAITIVKNIVKDDNYNRNDDKSDDSLEVYYFESLKSNLDVIIYNTLIQKQKKIVGFRIFKNKDRK